MTVIWKGETNVEFEYRDASGNLTTRDLLLREVYDDYGTVYLKGYSFLREDDRTFRFDRVQSDIVDKETGEILKFNLPARKKSSGLKFKTDFIKPRSDALVKVRDETNYKELYRDLSEDYGKLTKNIFLGMITAYDVHIIVDSFLDFLTPENFKRLKYSGSFEFVKFVRNIVENGYSDQPVLSTGTVIQAMLKAGFFEEVSDPLKSSQLQEMKMQDLRELAKSIEIKPERKKADLVMQLMASSDKLAVKNVIPTKKLFSVINNIVHAYIHDVEATIEGAPDVVRFGAYDSIIADGFLPDEILENFQNKADDLEETIQKRSDDIESDLDDLLEERLNRIADSHRDIERRIDDLNAGIEEMESEKKGSSNTGFWLAVGLVVFFVFILL